MLLRHFGMVALGRLLHGGDGSGLKISVLDEVFQYLLRFPFHLRRRCLCGVGLVPNKVSIVGTEKANQFVLSTR